jgi:hypothetical protein
MQSGRIKEILISGHNIKPSKQIQNFCKSGHFFNLCSYQLKFATSLHESVLTGLHV